MYVESTDSTQRGIMYDAFGTDSDKIPPEGAAVATSWALDSSWSRVSGKRFGAVPEAYLHASVHEIGQSEQPALHGHERQDRSGLTSRLPSVP
jgi:hypothetical protein